MRVGVRLRAIRLQNRQTLAGLASASGVSKSMLSRIERNESSPTVATLDKIAGALGVDLAAVFSDPGADDTAGPTPGAPPVVARDRSLDAGASRNANGSRVVSVVRGHQRKRLLMPWGAAYEMLCPDMQHRIEFIQIVYPVGGGSDDLYAHEGEECGVVVEGRFRGIVGDQKLVLEAGDSIYYSSSIPHRWENAGDVEAKAIWAVTPPTF